MPSLRRRNSTRKTRPRKTNKTYPRPLQEQYIIGNFASMIASNAKTLQRFQNVTLRQVKYYREKVEQNIHWGTYGGLRSYKVTDVLLCHILLLLSWVCDFNPGFTLHEYVELIYWTYGVRISLTWVHNIFTNLLHFSYRKLNIIQRSKFTQDNVNYYYMFQHWIQAIDCTRIVWVDESHFDSRVQKPRHGRGLKGKRIHFVSDCGIKENFSLTALMRPGKKIYYEIHHESNDQWDFFNFMISAFSKGHINPGDYVIFDNASVHSADSMLMLDEYFSALGIELVRTPTYSPELNAIEKLFGYLKDKIYHGKARNMKMEEFLAQHIPLVPAQNIIEWTRNCVFYINFD